MTRRAKSETALILSTTAAGTAAGAWTGSKIGIAAMGTAIAATGPLAVVGCVGGAAVGVLGVLGARKRIFKGRWENLDQW